MPKSEEYSDNESNEENSDEEKNNIKEKTNKVDTNINVKNCDIMIEENNNGFFVKLFNMLTDCVNDVPLEFYKNKKDKGIRMLTLTDDKTLLVRLSLDGSKMKSFHCNAEVYRIHIELKQLYECLRKITDSYVLKIYILKSKKQILNILGINTTKKGPRSKLYEVPLIVGDNDNKIPKIDFEQTFCLSSAEFYGLCKDIYPSYSYVVIKTTKKEIIFTALEDKLKAVIDYDRDKTNSDIASKSNYTGEFEIRLLNMFCKSNKLSKHVYFYFSQNNPLVLYCKLEDDRDDEDGKCEIGKLYYFITPTQR